MAPIFEFLVFTDTLFFSLCIVALISFAFAAPLWILFTIVISIIYSWKGKV